MSAIAKRWTGDGLPDGTVLTAGNVNTAGNGDTVVFNSSGTATIVTEGSGFRVSDAASSGIRRIDMALSGTGARTQDRVKVDVLPTGGASSIRVVRDGSANKAVVLLNTDGTLQLSAGGTIAASVTPAVALGDVLLIDLVAALHSSPTTANGRVFYRVKNLTNPAWASGGEFFYDSGYTRDLGVANFASTRVGKMSTELLGLAGILYELPGWEDITVNVADTSVSAAKGYFADAPTLTTPLATPVLTVVEVVQPHAGATDGSIRVSWPAVAGADHYEAGIADGDVTTGFTTVSTAATSPFTFSGLGAGQKTVAIKAKASA